MSRRKPEKEKPQPQPQRQPLRGRGKPPFELVPRGGAGGGDCDDDEANASRSTSFEDALEGVVQLLRDANRIVVLTGAGISVSCGIPDFRTKGSGLYSTLDAEALGLSCPEELFDFDVFLDNPQPFFKFARNLYYPLGGSAPARPSDSHKLLALLEQRKKLLRVYSQNIDGLEEEAGVSAKKVVYAHGSLQHATCCKCKRKVPADEIRDDIWNGVVARCKAAIPAPKGKGKSGADRTRSCRDGAPSTAPPGAVAPSRSSARKRSREADEPPKAPSENGLCGGVMKPGVTFFGEHLNDNVRRCLEVDRDKVDALIVMGTSLSVAPISKVVGYLPANIPRILINRTIVHPSHPQDSCGGGDDDDDGGTGTGTTTDDAAGGRDFRENYVFDAYLLGYCDDVTRALTRRLFSAGPGDSASTVRPSKAEARPRPEEEGALLACLEGEEEGDGGGGGGGGAGEGDVGGDRPHRRQDWTKSKIASKIPPERVFLFPGAVPPPDDAGAPVGAGDDAAAAGRSSSLSATARSGDGIARYEEIAHCDGCARRVDDGIVHKCRTCFDYDLCPACYEALAGDHHGGAHEFVVEKVASLVLPLAKERMPSLSTPAAKK